jgi:hypothetical protein
MSAPDILWHLPDHNQNPPQHLYAANHTSVVGSISTNTPILATAFAPSMQLALGESEASSSKASSFPTPRSPSYSPSAYPDHSTPASPDMGTINSSPFPFTHWSHPSMPQSFVPCAGTGAAITGGDMAPSQQQDAFFHIGARQQAAPVACGTTSGYMSATLVRADLDLGLGLDMHMGMAMAPDADPKRDPRRCFGEMGPGMGF